MVSISMNTAISLLTTLGPFLIPKLLSLYRSARAPRSSGYPPVIPLPRGLSISLNALFLSALIALLSTIPYFLPENIFQVTQTRMQAPTDVLFNRLSTHRPLTPADELLRARLVSLESRLLYFQYGPAPLTYCRFCNSDTPLSFFWYALPALAAPHLLHLVALGLASSGLIGGKPAARFRYFGCVLGLMPALVEVYAVVTYNHKLNLSSTRVGEIDTFHWKMQIWRGVGIAVLDAAAAGLVWAVGTNRLWVVPEGKAERLERVRRRLEGANAKLHALGVARNVLVREETLREKSGEYWTREGKVVREVFEEREVVEGMNLAVGRLDVAEIQREAGGYAEKIVSGWGDEQKTT
ncbi:MAG: hypothetical protein M1814_006262 [Vezdaea aestivalis]|nr:MAG: hypothetical protein M1814_006262 [Vezdaea aestivalis]